MKELFENFVNYVEQNKLPVISMVLSDKDGIIFSKTLTKLPRRNIYSHTKSFTSTCIGILINDGKLTLEDRVVDILKDDITEKQYNEHKEIKIKHLLTMSSGLGEPLLFERDRVKGVGYPSYLQYLMNKKQINAPGTSFLYSNGDSHLLSIVITKLTGKTLNNFAYERLFKYIGIPYTTWTTDPEGYSFGASGYYLTTEEMNKLGIFYLNNCQINGEQIVPKDWISNLCNSQIHTGNDNDWSRGYSYQFWIMPKNKGFRADGLYGQFTMIFPNDNIAFSMQCPENGNLDLVLDAFNKIVVDKY